MSNKSTSSQVYEIISRAIDYLQESYKGSSLTDIYLLLDKDSGELVIYDDEQNLVSQSIIDGWSSCEDITIVRELRTVVSDLDLNQKFDKLDVFKPFSVNLADQDFIIIEELLLIEDESIIHLKDDFMKRIDTEFDDFIEKLMTE